MLPKMSFGRGAIKAGLQRRWQANHGALTTEQAHASGSIMMKMHRTYGDETMRDRAYALQTQPLLHADPMEKKLISLSDRLEKVKERNPTRVCALPSLGERPRHAG
jgi:hypothetical protein